MTESRHQQLSIPEALKRGLTYMTSLHLCATACRVNFQWMQFHGSHSLPLLDFDVIGGAFPTIIAQKHIERYAFENEPLRVQPIGPNTLRALLLTLDEYSLPPGTVGELFAHQQKATGRVSDQARKFLATLSAIQENQDPSSLFTPQNARVGDSLVDDISRLFDQISDLRLVDQLVKKNKPIADYFDVRDSRADSGAVDAFKATYQYLANARPRVPQNNLHDALNVSLVVRLYNDRVRKQSSGPIPILISDTELVKGFESLSKWLVIGPDRHTPWLFNDHVYLIISQGLLQRSGGRYRAASNEAEIFCRQAQELEHIYSEILTDCHSKLRRGTSENKMTMDDLPKHDLSLLQFKRSAFNDEWRSLLAPSVRTLEQDRVELLQVIDSPQIKEMLRATESTRMRDGAKALEAALRQNQTPEYDMWELLQTYAKAEPTAVLRYSSIFRITFSEQEGYLLRELVPGTPISQFELSLLDKKHDIRVAVFPEYLYQGAIFVVDSWRDPESQKGRRISISWCHAYVPIKIVEVVASLLGNILNPAAVVEVALYTPSRKHINRLYIVDLVRHVAPMLEELSDADYVQFTCAEKFTAFADLKPLDNDEKQCGISCEAGALGGKVVQNIVEAIIQTADFPIDVEYLSEIVNKIGSTLKIGEAD